MPDPETGPQHFSEALKQAMQASSQPNGKAWTDNALATAIGAQTSVAVSVHYIAALRKGAKSNPRVELVTAIATVLGVPVSVFAEPPDPLDALLHDMLNPHTATQHARLRRTLALLNGLTEENQLKVNQYAQDLSGAQQNP